MPTHVDYVIEKINEVTDDDPRKAFIATYKAVYDDFDNMPAPVPFGRANAKTNVRILDALMDKFPNHRVLLGMLWVNKGFSVDPKLPDNIIRRGDE